MSGRKALVGLSLLCALVFCAFGAASASAAGGTTAYTCDPNASEKDFSDAHCDNNVGPGSSFGHTAIVGTTSNIVATNNLTGEEKSSWILNGTIAGIAIEITCGTVHASGISLTNNAGPPMSVTGSGKLEVGECKLLKPTAQAENCTVAVATSEESSATVNGKMEMKFSPKTGTTFTEITIANATGKTCKGVAGTFKVEGSAAATGKETGETPKYSGATLHFTKAMTGETLIFAGNKAELEGTLTFRMGPNAGEGNPIVFTTE